MIFLQPAAYPHMYQQRLIIDAAPGEPKWREGEIEWLSPQGRVRLSFASRDELLLLIGVLMGLRDAWYGAQGIPIERVEGVSVLGDAAEGREVAGSTVENPKTSGCGATDQTGGHDAFAIRSDSVTGDATPAAGVYPLLDVLRAVGRTVDRGEGEALKGSRPSDPSCCGEDGECCRRAAAVVHGLAVADDGEASIQ